MSLRFISSTLPLTTFIIVTLSLTLMPTPALTLTQHTQIRFLPLPELNWRGHAKLCMRGWRWLYGEFAARPATASYLRPVALR